MVYAYIETIEADGVYIEISCNINIMKYLQSLRTHNCEGLTQVRAQHI